MLYSCCDDRRRNAVRQHPTLNGIDYLELSDDLTIPENQRLRTLYVHCMKPLNGLSKTNVKIQGGERIRNIAVTGVAIGRDAQSNTLMVQVDKPGDFSTYQLQLLLDNKVSSFDPLLTTVSFTFKTENPNDFDCQAEQTCASQIYEQPEINYMAKDYAGFRQLMLDRLTALIPQWKERSPADMGMVLVELLAYVGDYLSYQQDVIATESYLGTARRRISVRRHARLLDYFISEGSNARTWIHVRVNADIVKRLKSSASPVLPKGTRFLTQIEGLALSIPSSSPTYNQALALQPTVFETMYTVGDLYKAHNEMYFYTWGARDCCLPKGTTKATLQGHLINLKAGDVLIFEEVYGPHTGVPEDADITHRCAVRLTKVTHTSDPLGKWFKQSIIDTAEQIYDTVEIVEERETEEVIAGDDLIEETLIKQEIKEGERDEKVEIAEENEAVKKTGELAEVDYSLLVTEIEWHIDDALPFPLCISATTAPEHGQQYIENVSVVRGNIVLADHGLTFEDESFEPVPSPSSKLFKVPSQQSHRCQQHSNIPILPRFYPSLKNTPLTHAGPSVEKNSPVSASATINWATMNPDALALPAISLHSTLQGENRLSWRAERDLLHSDPTTPAFVVEIEADGTTCVRFGDNRHGMFPEPQTQFTAAYRVGNGVQGNIGADSLVHIVDGDPRIILVRNPLPARGGVEPESVEDVRQKAPGSFLKQGRAVVPNDYVELAKRNPAVKKANAVQRWTGSWYTVFMALERVGGAAVDDDFKHGMYQYMEQYRMAGSDLQIFGPVYVSLEIAMTVTVKENYFRNRVKAALMDVFSNRVLPNGERGYFYPDNFSFGQAIYISPLRSATMAVPGVNSVELTMFQRQGIPSQRGLIEGAIALDWMEIARLDNDPNFQEHGIFRLNVEGGK